MNTGDTFSKHNILLLLRTRDAEDFDLGTLIEWSRSQDSDLRDWATFHLGSLLDVDTGEIRQALRDRLNDPDLDTRCEAFVGLARRSDKAAFAPVLTALKGDNVSTMMIEAAGYFGRAEFVPALQALRSWWDVDPELLERTIAHCSGERRHWWFDQSCAWNDNA